MSTATTTTRIAALPDEALSPAATETLGAVKAKLGMVPNLHRTLGHAPAALDAYVAMSGTLGRGELAPTLREKIALAVAARNGCSYCASAHTAIGGSLKIDAEELTRNLDGASSDPRDAAALAFVGELLTHTGRVPDAALAAVREAGFSEAEIVEITAHVGLNIFTNMVNELAGTEIDFPRVELTR